MTRHFLETLDGNSFGTTSKLAESQIVSISLDSLSSTNLKSWLKPNPWS